MRAEAEATAKAEAEALARAAATVPSQVWILAAIKIKASSPSTPGPLVPNPSAPPASNKKKRKRKNKPAASGVASTPSLAVPTPTQPPVKVHRPLPRYHQPEVDHRLAPLPIPGPSSAPRVRSSNIPKKMSRREEAKALSWKQRKTSAQQRQVEKSAVNAAAGWVDPRWALAVAAAAVSPPRLPPVVTLPPYPARLAMAPSRLAPSGPPVQPTNATPEVQPWRLQPPHMECPTF